MMGEVLACTRECLEFDYSQLCVCMCVGVGVSNWEEVEGLPHNRTFLCTTF